MMRTRTFGPTGVEVPVIGQGTWKLHDKHAAERAIRVGIELGLTHIDTAELYTGAEAILAPVLRDHRDELFVVSKVHPENAARDAVVRACDESLKRLRAERLDLYLLHWPSDAVPLAETIGALESLVDDGKTRFIGVSNFEPTELEEARRLATRHPIVCDQVLYHLGDRGIENELVPACGKSRVAVVGYSPFGSGEFPPGGKRSQAALESVAKRHGKTTRQVALNFLVRHPATFTIPKAENEKHVRENAAALDFELTKDDLAALDAAYPRPDAGEPLGTI